jgi:hypothetical protein
MGLYHTAPPLDSAHCEPRETSASFQDRRKPFAMHAKPPPEECFRKAVFDTLRLSTQLRENL